MTDDELRAAAIGILNPDTRWKVTPTLSLPDAANMLARAWLAEHDETLLSRPWLMLIGARDISGSWMSLNPLNGKPAICFRCTDWSNVGLYICQGGHIKDHATVGDALKLISALGITIKEPSNGEDKTDRV